MTSRLIPICGSIHPDDVLEVDGTSNGIQKECSNFFPSFTNNGLCLTRNGYEMDKLFKHKPRRSWVGDKYNIKEDDMGNITRLTTFKKIFFPTSIEQKIVNISKKQSEYHFTLIIDGNRYNNFKSGKNWTINSHEKIKIGIHSPEEIADIRGWYNKIINVATGHITTINVKPSQQQSEPSIINMPIKHRKCRFPRENEDFLSMKNYTQVHCLMDCKLKLAENICGCRPWDYPDKELQIKNDRVLFTKICDFFGKSCFDKILRQYRSLDCENKCVSDCNKISYSIDVSEKPLDPKSRICDMDIEPTTKMEAIIKDYVFEVLERNGSLQLEKRLFAPPESSMMNQLKDILKRHDNKTRKTIIEEDCKRKLENDISVVVVSIDSPTFSRTRKGVKATTLDKLAYVG